MIPTEPNIEQRPGGYDPNYRTIPPSTIPNTQPNKIIPEVSPKGVPMTEAKGTPLQAEPNIEQRPGGYDPNYRTIPTYPSNNLRGPKISNAEGLDRAYETENNVYGYGDTLFISGTKGSIVGKDWRQNMQYIGVPWLNSLFYDDKVQAVTSVIAPTLALSPSELGILRQDNTKIKVYETDRYKEAEKALKANPNIKRVVGHSLGGAVALELQKNFPYLKGDVYGTPYADPLGKAPEGPIQRFRQAADPISILDNSAQTSIPTSLNTHDYHSIANDHFTSNPSNAYGYTTPDGQTALIQ